MHCATDQALNVWAELEDAYHGANGFGGDTAEIYAYRLMPMSPSYSITSAYEMPEHPQMERRAWSDLIELCAKFQQHRNCKVVIDDVPLEDCDPNGRFIHRSHVQVIH
jgi:hypothetical protein